MSIKPPPRDRSLEHWKRLGLMPGAPECVIKAAHRFQIEQHHPDREGGDVAAAQRVNVAYDELRGLGSKANEHVAAQYNGEPWHVLGIAANADRQLVERAAKALHSELRSHARLAQRVDWAVVHFGRPARARPPQSAPPAPPRRATARPERAKNEPAVPGRPDGLMQAVDFGDVQWGDEQTRELRLTWRELAPYKIDVDTEAPITAQVTASKALPGRFVVALSIDWESAEFAGGPRVRGYSMDLPVTVRWASGGEAMVRVRGTVHYPAVVSASPASLDLGTVAMKQDLRAEVVLISSATTTVGIEQSAWLTRVDGGGRSIDAPLRLTANTPVRVAFMVDWNPIIARTAATAPGRPVRPTGKITVRWNDQRLDVPVQMVATRR